MNIVQLETQHEQFYAPTVQVLVDQRDLMKDEGLEIASVQIDNTLKGADQFSFTINNIFDLSRREFIKLKGLFEMSKPVEIRMGYLSIKKLKPMLKGVITTVKASYPSGGLPQLTVSGYDQSYSMMQGKKSENWDKKKDSEIAQLIAKAHKLNPDVQDSKVVHPKTTQHQQSDYKFLESLAERNGYELYVFGDTLVFKPPANDKSGIITLEWGKGLLSFTPEVNIAEQLSKVEVRGWHVDRKETIVGTARTGDEPGRDPGRQSGGEANRQVANADPVLRIRQPVHSQQEADQRAKAILKKRSEGFVKGSGESIGIPDILADTNIILKGLGDLFSKAYYVEQSTHTINTSGYKTTFRVKDTTI
jgi:phage protein D